MNGESDCVRAIPDEATHTRERFWEKVDIGSKNECWEWERATVAGYGYFWQGERMRLAHRISYRMETGPIPSDKQINHECGNSRCVNPNHLYAGTSRENWEDAVRHGTRERKLTDDDVREIRRRYSVEDVTQSELAEEYGVATCTISQVLSGQRHGAI